MIDFRLLVYSHSDVLTKTVMIVFFSFSVIYREWKIDNWLWSQLHLRAFSFINNVVNLKANQSYFLRFYSLLSCCYVGRLIA